MTNRNRERKRCRRGSDNQSGGFRRRWRPTVTSLEARALLSTLTVSDTSDSGAGSLRAAIAQANSDVGGDTIIFSSLFNTPQTITLTSGQLSLTNSAMVTIKGPGAALLSVSGGDNSRVFYVQGAAAISGLTITGGNAGTSNGGGLFNDGGTLSLTDCKISGNTTKSDGGNLYNNGGTLVLTNCTISDDSPSINVNNGGGLFNNGGSASLTGCTVSDNSAEGQGGGVFNKGGTLNLTNCTVSGNSAMFGAGLYDLKTVVTLSGSTLSDNSFSFSAAAGSGGGLRSVLGTLAVSGSTISGNSAGYGGGLFTINTPTTLTDCVVSGNSAVTANGSPASPEGGGMYFTGGTVALSGCTISGNSAAKGKGAGLYNSIGTLSLTNCTVTGNSGAAKGGGLYNGNNATMSLVNATVSGNSATTGGGVYNCDTSPSQATLSLTNTIVAGNTQDDVVGPYTGSNDLIGGNPMLGTLGDYGGPTPVLPLLPGSPAIGGGTAAGAPATDQRGLPRDPHIDIGAFQSEGSTFIVNTTSDGVGSGLGQLSLRQATNLTNLFGTNAHIEFDTSVFNAPKTIKLTAGPLSFNNPAQTIIQGPGANLLTISGGGASGVFAIGGGKTYIGGLTISGGNSYRGGGIENDGNYLALHECTISGNNAAYGGGLSNSGTMYLDHCTVASNYSRYSGGGLANQGGTLSISECTITNNSGPGNASGLERWNGGGIYSNGTLSLQNTTVSGNKIVEGGGVFIKSGSAKLDNVTLINNSALFGGGLFDSGGAVSLTNATVTGNSVPNWGGGLYTNSNITLSLFNCTVTGNYSEQRGAGIDTGYGSATLTNTIVSGQRGSADVAGTVFGSHNLIGGDPLFGPLGNYGGATLVFPLLPGSPAIGAGTTAGAPTTDQRGKPRVGHVDLGAFQSQGFTITPVAGSTPQSTVVGKPFTSALAVTVKADNPAEPVDGGVITFSAPKTGATANLSASTATIAGGQAGVTATAGTIAGSYTVTASAAVAKAAASFALTNTEAPSSVVTTTADEVDATDGLTSLREAIAYANSHPGPDTIMLSPGLLRHRRQTIRLTGGPLVLTDPATTTIVGPGARRLTINAGGLSRVFDVEGGSLVLEGLTITGGRADRGGGILNDGGTLTLKRVAIRGNRARVGGGLFNDGTTTLSHVVIRGNAARVGCGLFSTRTATLTHLGAASLTASGSILRRSAAVGPIVAAAHVSRRHADA